jgi:hypothetical protein
MQLRDFDSSGVISILGESRQARYLVRYLKEIGASKFVVEEKYIDRDYLTDYSKFYAKSHEEFGRFATRLHFFKGLSSEKDVMGLIDKKAIEPLQKNYLGFVVVKPIKDGDGNLKLIGRTLLKTYDKVDGTDKRKFIQQTYVASLYGIPLSVDSLAFQAQDNGVSACATIALWSAVHPLCRMFRTPRNSPSEITEISFSPNMSSPPVMGRVFPSDGLTLWQMISYLRYINLDIESIEIESNSYEHIVKDVVKTYVDSSMPLIAVLELTGNGDPAYHAAVVSGYRINKQGDITEIYVHDDQIGPFCRVKSDDGFRSWKNEWVSIYGYTKVNLTKFIIPIYPKIRLPYAKLYPFYARLKEEKEKEVSIDLSIQQVNNYKAELLNADIENKEQHLKAFMPRFMWIMRRSINGKPDTDVIYDGTSIYPRRLEPVLYSK